MGGFVKNDFIFLGGGGGGFEGEVECREAGEAEMGAEYLAGVRYTFTGVLDTTFGTGGKVTSEIGSGADRARAVVIDSQDRFGVAGVAEMGDEDFAVVRYTSTGVLATTFGTGG